MSRTRPINEWLFVTIVIALVLFCIFCIARFAKADDGSLKDAVDRLKGTQVRDAGDYSVKFTVKDTPTGQRVYDPKGNWLYKIEDNKVYNMDRERVYNIDKDTSGKK